MPVHAQAVQVCEISGHLIDSLTLAKVIDLIQQAQCRYQITDIRIGMEKQDVSFARVSLFANDDDQLQRLLKELQPYGVRQLSLNPVHTQPAPADGQVPTDAYVLPIPELSIYGATDWQSVDTSTLQAVIVLQASTNVPHLVTIAQVKAGDAVVINNPAGIRTISPH